MDFDAAIAKYIDAFFKNIGDDHAMLQQSMVLYDALYPWCRHCQQEEHTWKAPA